MGRRYPQKRAYSAIDVLNFSHYLYDTTTSNTTVYDCFNRVVIFVYSCPEVDSRIVISKEEIRNIFRGTF